MSYRTLVIIYLKNVFHAIEKKDDEWLARPLQIIECDEWEDERDKLSFYWYLLFELSDEKKVDEFTIQGIIKLCDKYYHNRDIPEKWLREIMERMIRYKSRNENGNRIINHWKNILLYNIHSSNSRRFIRNCLLIFIDMPHHRIASPKIEEDYEPDCWINSIFESPRYKDFEPIRPDERESISIFYHQVEDLNIQMSLLNFM